MASTTTFFFLSLLFSLFSLSYPDDADIMSKLLFSLSPTPSGWSSSAHFCQWKDVKCDSTNSHVTSINLDSMSLSGTLPAEINQLSSLQTFAVQRNSLSGFLPSFSNMSLLEEIHLDGNNFDSIPPNFLLGLPNLRSFKIDDNYNLSPWEIPLYLTESSTLAQFSASNACLTGVIPDIFYELLNLQDLRLSYNNLTGSLPASFGGTQIQNLFLNNQKRGLSGSIDVLSSMVQLSHVWLHVNSFTGQIPDLSKCPNLNDLQLRDNQFTGRIPASLSLLRLVNNTLQNNKLQGPIPEFATEFPKNFRTNNSFCKDTPGPCDPQVTALLDVARAIGYPISLADSWKGNDACQDWKFITCDSERNVVIGVNLGKQGFSGTISPSFGFLTSLRNLILNDNNLMGMIPDVLITLPELQILDVSNNNLSGVLPPFPARVKLIYNGNHFIPTGDRDGGGGGSEFLSNTAVVFMVAIAVATFVFAFLLNECYVRRRHNRRGSIDGCEQGIETVESSEIPIFEGGKVFSIELLREVTNNFSEENILGRGGYGVVYKGELPDGTKIAVKRMESRARGSRGREAFQAEISVLTNVRHRHLVALLGYCINGNEILLVYEYMPQGTLSRHLFNWWEHGWQPLTWDQRVTIALDVARGVEYLHRLAPQSFIHRDLKPPNILLGDDMRAKVADFGLVRNAPDGNYSVETRVAGTPGYIAPEYEATGRVTTKVDVYAFGVVLMEIITGRNAFDPTLSEKRSQLRTWFSRLLVNKRKIRRAIDPTLHPDEGTYESIWKVAKLAGHCTARKPLRRPDMGHVVNVLSPLVEHWEPSNLEEEEGS